MHISMGEQVESICCYDPKAKFMADAYIWYAGTTGKTQHKAMLMLAYHAMVLQERLGNITEGNNTRELNNWTDTRGDGRKARRRRQRNWKRRSR